MSLVYIFGSGECDQLGLGDDQPFEIKKPRRIPFFDTGLASRRILKVVCGGMHTVALSNLGKVYTWGCNDEGALGREGPENTPIEVANTLAIPATDIAAGDSHTLAYNTELNQVYTWGLYRNAMSGKTSGGVKVPTRIGEGLFNSQKKVYIQRVASGAHHTLVLTRDGKVYAWGDPESGKIGRMLNTRNKDQQALRIEKVGARNAQDIFCGNHHSFYINNKGQVFGWGLNNHGQLGIGNKENTSVPTHVKKLDGLNTQMIAGGEHHTIAVTAEGKVYCWGRNDEAQCGLGDLYGAFKKKKAQEEYERLMKEEEAKLQQAKLDEEQKKEEEKKEEGQIQAEERKEENKGEEQLAKKKAGNRKQTLEQTFAKEEDLSGIGYFTEPQLVSDLWDDLDPSKQIVIVSVFAKGNYNYALEMPADSKTNQLYSWGMGENYVLGSREDDNQFKPYKVHPKMFEEMPVLSMGTGTQHVVVLTSDSQDKKVLPDFEREVLEFKLPEKVVVVKQEKIAVKKEQPKVAVPMSQPVSQAQSKKRSREDFERSHEVKDEEKLDGFHKEEQKAPLKKPQASPKATPKKVVEAIPAKKTPSKLLKKEPEAVAEKKAEQQNVKRRKVNKEEVIEAKKQDKKPVEQKKVEAPKGKSEKGVKAAKKGK